MEVAALLHDIGKIGVPDAILKKNGPLTAEERSIIKRHPEYSWSILSLFPGLEEASFYALHHHESADGTGYPAGLKGQDIPLVSRIISVIDAYDAMVRIAATAACRSGLAADQKQRHAVGSRRREKLYPDRRDGRRGCFRGSRNQPSRRPVDSGRSQLIRICRLKSAIPNPARPTWLGPGPSPVSRRPPNRPGSESKS